MKMIAAGWLLALTGSLAVAQTDSKAAGHWQGKIQIPDHELSITVDLTRNAKGVWIGSMSVTGSTSIDVPLASVTVEGAAVRFGANLPQPAAFDGQLSADGNGLSGKASNADGSAPFVLTRDGEANVKVPPPSSPLSKEFEGTWDGSINAAGKDVRIRLKLSPGADGAAAATLIAVDQGNQEIPVNTVTIEGKQLRLELRVISGTYRGTLGAAGEIAGEWSQGPAHLPLTFTRVAPEPKKQ